MATSQPEHDELSVAQGVGADLVSAVAAAGCAQLDASEHGEIYRASLEHRPLFRLSVRLHTPAGGPVYFQEDWSRFGHPNTSCAHTLRLLLQQEYKLRLDISDLGRTLTALESVTIDQEALAIEERRLGFSERTNNHVFAVSGCWTPTHQGPTRNGQRDLALVEVVYRHANPNPNPHPHPHPHPNPNSNPNPDPTLTRHGAERQTFSFRLQMKVYAKRAKLTKGKRLGEITCRCDVSKQDERWTFLEARPAKNRTSETANLCESPG